MACFLRSSLVFIQGHRKKMNKLLTQGRLSVALIVLVLVIDQVIKIAVKTSMYFHESIRVTDWFYIYFTENNGMAFGMEIFGKLFLTVFRIVAVGAIAYYLCKLVKKGTMKTGFIVCLSLILAGAAGNIIDSVFYGEIFSESTPFQLARFVPWGEGYTSLFHGRVVDMFYFPLFQWNGVPRWLSFLVDSRNYFFGAIFNLADAYISVAVVYLLIFQYKFFKCRNRPSRPGLYPENIRRPAARRSSHAKSRSCTHDAGHIVPLLPPRCPRQKGAGENDLQFFFLEIMKVSENVLPLHHANRQGASTPRWRNW